MFSDNKTKNKTKITKQKTKTTTTTTTTTKTRLTTTRTIDIKMAENSQVQNNLRTRPQLIASTAAGNTVTKTVSVERTAGNQLGSKTIL